MKLTNYEPGGMLQPSPDRKPIYQDDPSMTRLVAKARAEVPGFDRMDVFRQHKVLMQLKKEGV